MSSGLREAALGIVFMLFSPWIRGLLLFGGRSYLSLSLEKQYFLKDGLCSLIIYSQLKWSGTPKFASMGLSLGHSLNSPLWTGSYYSSSLRG